MTPDANPAQGAMPATPDTGAGNMGEEAALARIGEALGEEEPREEPQPPPQPADEPEEVAASEEVPEPQPVEAEQAETEELPDTLNALADAVGLSADEFAAHLKVPITVNGKSAEVTLQEALKGFQLESDYTRKAQELAHQRRELEGRSQQIQSEWQSRMTALDSAISTMQAQLTAGFSREQLARIRETEGLEAYYDARDQAEAIKERIGQAQQVRMQEIQQAQQQQAAETDTYRRGQHDLLVTAMPDLGDTSKRQAIEQRFHRFLEGRHGFTSQEVHDFFNGVWDHRQILILNEAAEAWEAKENGRKTVRKLKLLPKVNRPGQASSKADQEREQRDATTRKLRRTGSDGAALDWLEERGF